MGFSRLTINLKVILDRRPFNELERRLVWARLPHGSLLTQLIVPRGFSIRGSGDDLSNYFYLLKHHESWLPRNVIGSVFDGEGFEKFGGKKGHNFLLSFRVIAMGDLNAVDIAQQVHLEILQDVDCMRPGSPVPASHTFEGLYIDDHIVAQVLPSKKSRGKHDTYRDEQILNDSRSQYESLGIPTSSKKAFSKEPCFVAWGTQVDNRTGQLGDVLRQACNLPKVSKKGLTGLLVHPFLHRRLAMSILQETFLWIESMKDNESKKLPHSVREELFSSFL